MRVKFFEGSAIGPLQDKINVWLKENPAIMTHAIIQSYQPGKQDKPGLILITLWYTERPPGTINPVIGRRSLRGLDPLTGLPMA